MSADHPLARRRSLTIEGYLSYPHVMVTVLATARTLVDDRLVAAGHNRRIGLRVPYYVSAVLAVEKTTLIATVPRAPVQRRHTDRCRSRSRKGRLLYSHAGLHARLPWPGDGRSDPIASVCRLSRRARTRPSGGPSA
jgi:hypothetical protein